MRNGIFCGFVLSAGLLSLFLVIAEPEHAMAQATKKKKKRVAEVYCDPKGRFTFEIPRLWSVSGSAETVVAIDSSHTVRAILQKMSGSPSEIIKAAAAKLPTPLTNLTEVERGDGHMPGGGSLYAIYAGKNGNLDWTVKIVASQSGWVLVQDNLGPLPLSESVARPEVRIEHTFTITEAGEADAAKVPPAPPATDLEALTIALNPRKPPTDEGSDNAPAASEAPYQAFMAANFGVVYRLRATTEFIVLFPDGSAIGSIPDPGLDGFNLQIYAQQMARAGNVGNVVARYQLFPDHLVLAFPNFSKSYGLPGTGEVGALVPLCQCNGTTFGGVYAWGNLLLQFSPDGTFIDRGALDNIVWKNFGAPRLAQGRYALQFNTLYLQYADGRQARVSFAAPAAQEGTGSFDWIAVRQHTGRRVQ